MHKEIIENFVDSILTGTPLFTPVAEGLKALELENAMLLSHLKNSTVPLPVNAQEFDVAFEQLIQ
ncbi:MAG: hypothetical protein GX946_05950 [Oligosphaeraceae bacterium]|nr:hypothetical protein [Oligosphaeraceae bacterium]